MNTQTIAPITAGPLLLLETSAPSCSVAVADLSTGALVEAFEDTPMRHTARLLPLIREAFAKTDFALAETVAVGVSAGPGSYSALRAGLSSAKGVCLALGVPLVLIPTAEAVAAALRAARPDWTGDFLPLLEARRTEVYWGRYTNDLQVLQSVACAKATEEWMSEQVARGPLLAGGSGAGKLVRLCTKFAIQTTTADSLARHLFTPCRLRLDAGKVTDLGAAEPNYVRAPHVTRAKSRL